MIKAVLLTSLLFLNTYTIPKRGPGNKDYLIVGQNTVQKIFYNTSSNYSINHTGKMAMDSDKKTYWISKKTDEPHWLEIDFGTKRLISKIIVYPGKKDNYRTVKYFTIQFLYLKRWFNFKRVDLEVNNTGFFKSNNYKDKVEIDLNGIDTSTFRIYVPEGGTYNGYAAFSEIEAYLGSSKIKYFDERLKGLYLPIKNGFLPAKDSGYPNAPRPYRGGRHVGIDYFYYHTEGSYDPVRITKKTPIFSADDGVIIRCDLNYKPMTVKNWKARSKYFKKNPRTFVKRSFGGRQVWIDHRNGIVTAYNHMSKISSGLKKGSIVKKGEKIGFAGNSGLFGEAEKKNYGVHLHFEIWIDGYYLGYGMSIKDVKKYVNWIFFPQQ